MTTLVKGSSATEAWLAALAHLRANGREEYDLIVEITDPSPDATAPQLVAVLDRYLSANGFADTRTVANTIFPEGLAESSRDPAELFVRYRRLLPRLRRVPQNRKGTYFGRLTGYPLRAAGKEPVNQLQIVIQDLRRELDRRNRRQGPMAHIYEAQVFAPGKDRRPIGFPCMSSLSFHLDAGRLHLSATYRNQYYIQRAAGNFLGLAALQRFVASAVGLGQGPLVVHAFHAEVDPDVSLANVDALIRDCRGALTPASRPLERTEEAPAADEAALAPVPVTSGSDAF